MRTPLVSARFRVAAAVALVLAVVGTAALALTVWHSGGTAFDEWALHRSGTAIGPTGSRVLLYFSDPAVSATVIALVALSGALARRWRLVALAAIGPGLAVVLTEYVLKPAIGRYLSLPGVPESVLRQMFTGAYPSGHETGVAAAAVLVLVAVGQLRLGAAARTAILAALLAWAALAALGLVRNYYHYATDTIGSLGVAIAIVLGGALLLDALVAAVHRRRPERSVAVSSPDVPSPARTVDAA